MYASGRYATTPYEGGMKGNGSSEKSDVNTTKKYKKMREMILSEKY